MRNITVVPYDPRWPALYQAEAACLRPLFGQALLSIHHVGSTAVPGLEAKPVLDIMAIVLTIEEVDSLNAGPETLGYVARGENGIPGRRYFHRGSDDHRTHHLHVYGAGHPEIARHLDFRDYLRAQPDVARRYGELKRELAQRFPDDIDGYMAGKDDFIRRTIVAAAGWRAAGGRDPIP